jgi:hypothetical protein
MSTDEQLWLHYGLILLQYPFFRLSVATIGRMSQYTDTITPKDIKSRLSTELGQLGALDKAVALLARPAEELPSKHSHYNRRQAEKAGHQWKR